MKPTTGCGKLRRLAGRRQVAAQEIGQLAAIRRQRAEKAGQLQDRTVPSIHKTSELAQQIAAATAGQSDGLNQITAR